VATDGRLLVRKLGIALSLINGVYFLPEHAEPLLKSLAEEQAKAISARQHLKK
jgi:hypothetical protein